MAGPFIEFWSAQSSRKLSVHLCQEFEWNLAWDLCDAEAPDTCEYFVNDDDDLGDGVMARSALSVPLSCVAWHCVAPRKRRLCIGACPKRGDVHLSQTHLDNLRSVPLNWSTWFTMDRAQTSSRCLVSAASVICYNYDCIGRLDY